MSRSDWKRPAEFSAPSGRRRVALELSYDGRPYCGWQSQISEKSVQETLKQAIVRLLGDENIDVVGSGRTDSGVHAYGQVAHVEFDMRSIPAKAFCNGLNSFLPSSIRIRRSWDVDDSFHARYSAMAREYHYFCKIGGNRNPFTTGLVTLLKGFPNLELLNSYAKHLIGTHDFTTFASARDICPSKVRDIYQSEFTWTTSMYGEKILCYTICGNAFLYHMVRSLVGSMLVMAELGQSPDAFKAALDAKNRNLAKRTAPADGLYLWRVSYDPSEYQWFEDQYGRQ